MRLTTLFLSAALAAGASTPALPGPGATSVPAGPYHLELHVKGSTLTLNVWNAAEQPVNAVEVQASALVHASARDAAVRFAPLGETLHGQAPFAIDANASVTVTFSVLDGPSLRAEFPPEAIRNSVRHRH